MTTRANAQRAYEKLHGSLDTLIDEAARHLDNAAPMDVAYYYAGHLAAVRLPADLAAGLVAVAVVRLAEDRRAAR